MDGELVTLPSGNVVLARHIATDDLLVEEDVIVPLLVELERSLEALPHLEEIFDRALPLIVIEPTIEPPSSSPSDRSGDCLYVDDVTWKDKVHLFFWSTRRQRARSYRGVKAES